MDDVEDVARLLTLNLIGTILLSPENSNIEWAYTTILDNFGDIGKYNWSKLILGIVMESLHAKRKKIGGCPVFLLFWLCERTNLIMPENAKNWPRFIKWDLRKLLGKLNSPNFSLRDIDADIWTMGKLSATMVEWSQVRPIQEPQGQEERRERHKRQKRLTLP